VTIAPIFGTWIFGASILGTPSFGASTSNASLRWSELVLVLPLMSHLIGLLLR